MRKNQKPEKLVEAELVKWYEIKKWSMEVVDSKATFSVSRGMYKSTLISGFSDSVGCDSNGHSAYVEFKAFGHHKAIHHKKNAHQKEFLLNKIDHGAFAVCIDSSLLLETYYNTWATIRASSVQDAQSYLRGLLA